MIKFLLFISCLHLHINAMAQPVPAMLSMKGIGGEKREYFNNLTKDVDGSPILSFNTSSKTGNINTSCNPTSDRTIFKKYTISGSPEWEKCIPASIDSSYIFIFPRYISNYLAGFDWLNRNILLRCEEKNGNILWSKEYGGSAHEAIEHIISTKDGGFIISGESNSNDGDVGFHYGSTFSFDAWVFKVDSVGDIIWKRVIGGTLDEKKTKVADGPNNGAYVMCTTESSDFDCNGFHGIQDVLVTRLNDTGGVVWSKCFGGSDDDYARAVISSKNGGVIIAANTTSNNGDITNHIGRNDFWIAEIDSNGVIVWAYCYGLYNSGEIPLSLTYSSDGSIWVVGNSVDSIQDDTWIVHLTSNGTLLSVKRIPMPASDEASGVFPLNDRLVMVFGEYNNTDASISEYPPTWYGLTDIYVSIFAPWTTGLPIIPKTSNNISIYPNPAGNILFITTPASTGTLSLADVTGKQLMQKNVTGTLTSFDVQALPRGSYNAIWQHDNNTISRKVIIE